MIGGPKTTFANYIPFSKGITGIMIDIADRDPECGEITADDFIFTNTGRDGPGEVGVNPFADVAAASPSSVVPLAGEGVDGSDRIVIKWTNAGGATAGPAWPNDKNAWLEVTVKANCNTCLGSEDVHWWGIAMGEGNIGNTTEAFPVASGDQTATGDCAQQQPQTCGNQFTDPKPVTEPLDYDKNGLISQAADADVASDNPAVSSLTQALRAFTPEPGPEEGDGELCGVLTAGTYWFEGDVETTCDLILRGHVKIKAGGSVSINHDITCETPAGEPLDGDDGDDGIPNFDPSVGQPGNPAYDLTIEGNGVTIGYLAYIDLSGGDGGSGGDGYDSWKNCPAAEYDFAQDGAQGGNAGAGGDFRIWSTGDVTIAGHIVTNGGNAGDGGDGGDDFLVHISGSDGDAGHAANAGEGGAGGNIEIRQACQVGPMTGIDLQATGGLESRGGNGGNGGNGGGVPSCSVGGLGGDAGNGGIARGGGYVILDGELLDLEGSIITTGGNGGDGGFGGSPGDRNTTGGPGICTSCCSIPAAPTGQGEEGGYGGFAGDGGAIEIYARLGQSSGGQIIDGDITTDGGDGGSTGASGGSASIYDNDPGCEPHLWVGGYAGKDTLVDGRPGGSPGTVAITCPVDGYVWLKATVSAEGGDGGDGGNGGYSTTLLEPGGDGSSGGNGGGGITNGVVIVLGTGGVADVDGAVLHLDGGNGGDGGDAGVCGGTPGSGGPALSDGTFAVSGGTLVNEEEMTIVDDQQTDGEEGEESPCP